MAAILRTIERRRRINHHLTLPRHFPDRQNPLEVYSPSQIRQLYRFWPPTIIQLTDMVATALTSETERSSPLPPLLQVTVSLRYLATGGFQSLVGEVLDISQSSTSRALSRFLEEMVRHCHDWVKMPTGREAEACKTAFYQIAGHYSYSNLCQNCYGPCANIEMRLIIRAAP